MRVWCAAGQAWLFVEFVLCISSTIACTCCLSSLAVIRALKKKRVTYSVGMQVRRMPREHGCHGIPKSTILGACRHHRAVFLWHSSNVA